MSLNLKKSSLLIACLLASTALVAASRQADRDHRDDFSSWRERPSEKFSNGSANFELVKKTLLKSYVDQGLTEDDLYRAAVQGMLNNINPAMASWNTLITPAEYAEMKSNIDGKIVGVGVTFNFNETTGYAEVLDVITGSSSAKAGIKRGDQVLKVDGQSFRGKQIRDIVYAIRGKSGSDVKLTLLHDDQVIQKTLKRETLTWDAVDAKMLDSLTGLVTIRYFTNQTPMLLKKGLENLKSKGVKRLIIDLRGNEGGILDSAVESISLLIPKDKLIVSAITRGKKEEKIKSSSDPVLTAIPMAVLMNGATKSGAEIMAAALKINARATTVGATTFGKWSAQRVEELDNKFAIKYTTTTFVAPNGVDLSGKGLAADIPVDFPEEEVTKQQSQTDLIQRLKTDVQLQVALSVLQLKA